MDEAELRRRWISQIAPDVFADAIHVREPVTIFLGGQPGAGKTASQGHVVRQVSGVVPIVGDDLRQYHPDYQRLVNDDPLRMPLVTASASAAWIKMSVDHANANGISSLIEGTWRMASTVLDEAQHAKALGRHTHAIVVAVPPALSRLGILNRYYTDRARGLPARWTPISAHDVTVANLPGVVREIVASDVVDQFTVMDRGGQILWTGSPSGAGSEVFATEFYRELSAREVCQYRGQVEAVERAYLVVNDCNTEAKDLLESVKGSFGLLDLCASETQRASAFRSTFGPASIQSSPQEATASMTKHLRARRRDPGQGSRSR